MLLFSQNPSLEYIVSVIIVLLISMTVHEFAHAAMATWWGDDTPRMMGRLTLNPLVHINWIGFLMFVIVGFGILGSVPVNTRRMRDPRWGSFWTSFAGPLSNLGLAIVFALIYRLAINNLTYSPLAVAVILFLQTGVLFNVLLFVFNLLPFFPIDGWHMVLALMPGYWLSRNQVPDFVRKNLQPVSQFLQQPAYKWQQWAQISQIVLIVLIVIGFAIPRFSPISILIGEPVGRLANFLMG